MNHKNKLTELEMRAGARTAKVYFELDGKYYDSNPLIGNELESKGKPGDQDIVIEFVEDW